MFVSDLGYSRVTVSHKDARKFVLLSVCSLLLLVFSSCQHKKSLKESIRQLQSCPIVLCLDSMECFYTECPSRYVDAYSLAEADMRLVQYVTSSECSPCVVKHLYPWLFLVDSLGIRYHNQLNVVLIFDASDKEKTDGLKIALQNAAFDYPVYLDTLGIFQKRNDHLLSNRLFGTFLLDKDGNILLVGDPINNEQIEAILFKTADTYLYHK